VESDFPVLSKKDRNDRQRIYLRQTRLPMRRTEFRNFTDSDSHSSEYSNGIDQMATIVTQNLKAVCPQ